MGNIYGVTVGGELYHYGKKGMKWGVRRYQNEDGSLTAAGERRYARDAREKGYKDRDDAGNYYKMAGKKGGRKEVLDVDANRYVRENRERTKRVLDESKLMTDRLRNANDSAMRRRQAPKMDLSHMSEKEMRDQINRAMLERQYNDMFNPQKTSKGREYVSAALETAGSVLAIGSSALGIALAIKELKG